jgi:uncharacterized protein YecT (DUF1311 family)
MKMRYTLPTAVCLAFAAVAVGCSKSNETPEVANVSQDTMLLRDLAEANKNTAEASAMDNSLTTIRTTGGGSLPENDASTRPGGSQVLTSGPRMTPPLKANDASRPTTVPTRLSPAGDLSSSGNPCDSPTTVDQRTCLNRSIVQNDAELNRTYQELIAQSRKSGGPELEERFRQAQRDWVNQRDAECRDVGQGALWAKARASCLASRSDSRTAELRRNLNSLRGQ